MYHVLSRTLEVVSGNAQEMRRRPGHKTDKADVRRIAEFQAHGIIRTSFPPPPPIQALCDLTCTGVALVLSRSQTKNRVHKILEDTNIKLSSVVADPFWVSGRRMLAVLMAAGRDPQALAALARGCLCRKLAEPELAIYGQFTVHHARLIALALEVIDLMSRQIAELDQQIEELITPLYPQIEQLSSIPGVEGTAVRGFFTEIGTDMSRFGSDAWLPHGGAAQAITRMLGSGFGDKPVKGIAICGGCWCNVPWRRTTRPRFTSGIVAS